MPFIEPNLSSGYLLFWPIYKACTDTPLHTRYNLIRKNSLLNIDVLVAFKLLIDNITAPDKEFKLLKIVVDLAFKLSIDYVEAPDKEFKLLNIVVDVAFELLIDYVGLVFFVFP